MMNRLKNLFAAGGDPSRRRFMRLPMALVVLLGGVLGFAVLVSTKPQTKPVENSETVWAVSALPVAYGDYVPRIAAYGELRALRQIDLRAQVGGEIVETGQNFEDGARVEEGELLIQIDPFKYQIALDDARAQVKGSKAVLAERKAAEKQAQTEYERALKLFKKGTVSRKTRDDLKTGLAIAKARREQQESVVERGNVQLRRAQRDLDNARVAAPFAGYLGRLNVRQGRVVNPNERLAILSGAGDYEVVFNLSDNEYGRFLARNSEIVGRPVTVSWRVGDETISLGAEIERVGAEISQATRGVDVYARLTGNVPSNLRSGAFVTIVLEAQAVPSVFAVPKDSVYNDSRVFIVQDGRLAGRQLTDFVDIGDHLLVRQGLEAGQSLLVTRFNEAAEGVAVKIVEAQ